MLSIDVGKPLHFLDRRIIEFYVGFTAACEAQREALYKAVYETDYWKTTIAPRVPECLDREKAVITRIVPTAKSTMA